jgi:hypothetical protein
MVISDKSQQAIKIFVQEILGCTCPDEIFYNIDIEINPSELADISQGDLIAIGDKLLVYLVSANEAEFLSDKLEQIFIRGREIRNMRSFNRFRLVVSSQREQESREILARKFASLENVDERLHLHVIAPEHLPDMDVQ